MPGSFIRTFKTNFLKLFNNRDKRAKIQDGDFIIGLLAAFATASSKFSLSTLRINMCTFLGKKIGPSAFNERIGTKSLMVALLQVIVLLLEKCRPSQSQETPELAGKLGVLDIVAVDASMVSLWNGLKDTFPGTFMTASIKLHFCISLVTGFVDWFDLTPGATHDSKRFPFLKAQQLYIFDLGYWSYSLLANISSAKAFFLTRVKSNAKLLVTGAISGFGKSIVGQSLFDIPSKRKRKKVVELICDMFAGGVAHEVRVIGFWDRKSKSYRWYITNLECDRDLVADLYRLRWQIELTFKAMKSTLKFDRMPTLQPNAAHSIALLAIINYLMSVVVRQVSTNEHRSKKVSPSIQRCAAVYAAISREFLRLLTRGKYLTLKAMGKCEEMLKLLIGATIDPNRKRRKSTFDRVLAEC